MKHISIIDLNNEYYLVSFTCEDDKNAALADGMWFIYDHYLIVKDWTPNFHYESDTIEGVTVWTRIVRFLIEYDDAKVLSFIGNRVDRSVEVNISKPLLDVFTSNGRKYKIEYELLHLYCLTCRRFGHYKEGCLIKTKCKYVVN